MQDAERAPVRVLQILTCDTLGGTELMTAALVERVEPRRIDVDVVTLDRPGPIADRLRTGGIAVESLGQRGLLFAFAGLARRLRREPYDIVNAYGIKSSFVARVLVRAFCPSSKFICGVRGLNIAEGESLTSWKSRMALLLESMSSRLVDVYDSNSTGALRLLEARGIDSRKFACIPNGVEVPPADLLTRSEGPPETAELICVARLVPRKRHVDIVHAIAQLRDQGLEFRSVFVGDGPSRDELQHLVIQLGVDDRVTFAGAQEPQQVTRLLQGASLFCLCSTSEGMPGSVMEAMAVGLPVVGSSVNGIEDLVVGGQTGLLVAPCQPTLLAAAIGRLLRDPDTRLAMGQAGRARIADRFTLDSMVLAKEALFESVAKGA